MSIERKEWYRNTFLKGEDWQNIRNEVIAHRQGTCYVCGEESSMNDVHHVYYAKALKETPKWLLFVLCRKCHDGVHRYTKDERHKTLFESMARFHEVAEKMKMEVRRIIVNHRKTTETISDMRPLTPEKKHLVESCMKCTTNRYEVEIDAKAAWLKNPHNPEKPWIVRFCNDCWDQVKPRIKWNKDAKPKEVREFVFRLQKTHNPFDILDKLNLDSDKHGSE